MRISKYAAVPALAGSLAVLLLVVLAGPATAHTSLVSSTPGDGARLDSAPTSVALTFNEPVGVDYARTLLQVDGEPAGAPVVRQGEDERTLVAEFPAGGVPDSGTWRLAYRVTSADGHPVEGAVTFEVAAASSAAATPEATAEDTAVPEPDAEPAAAPAAEEEATAPASSSRVWAFAGFLAAVIATLVLVQAALRRRRRSET